MDSTGLAELTINGNTSSPMLLNFNGPFSFFVGIDEADETYRVEGASMRVVGITADVPPTFAVMLAGLGLLAGFARRKRNS